MERRIKMMKIPGISVLIFIVAGLLHSAGAYTLDELMQQSVANRESIKIRKGNVEKSENNVTAARSFFVPDLTARYEAEKDLDQYDESSAFTVTSTLNVFSGFRDYNTLQAEKQSRQISELQLKGAKQDLQLQVAEGYTEVYRSIENLSVAKSSLDLYTERYETVKLKYETGLLTRRDMLAVKVEADNAGQVARRADVAVSKTLNNLSRITGINGLTKDQLDFKVLDTLPKRGVLSELEAKLLANRSELMIQKGLKDVNQKLYNAKKAEYLPNLNLSASYAKEDASYDPWDKHEDWAAQLAVSINLFNGLRTTSGMKNRKLDVINARHNLVELEKVLKTELANILLDFDVAEKNLVAANSGMDEAEENVRTTELAFSLGRATTTDVLNSIDSLTRAKQNVINARMDLILTDFRVKRMVEAFVY